VVHIDPSLDYGRKLRSASQVLAGSNENLHLIGESTQTHQYNHDMGHGYLFLVYA